MLCAAERKVFKATTDKGESAVMVKDNKLWLYKGKKHTKKPEALIGGTVVECGTTEKKDEEIDDFLSAYSNDKKNKNFTEDLIKFLTKKETHTPAHK